MDGRGVKMIGLKQIVNLKKKLYTVGKISLLSYLYNSRRLSVGCT